jgi:hypothetical protein
MHRRVIDRVPSAPSSHDCTNNLAQTTQQCVWSVSGALRRAISWYWTGERDRTARADVSSLFPLCGEIEQMSSEEDPLKAAELPSRNLQTGAFRRESVRKMATGAIKAEDLRGKDHMCGSRGNDASWKQKPGWESFRDD